MSNFKHATVDFLNGTPYILLNQCMRNLKNSRFTLSNDIYTKEELSDDLTGDLYYDTFDSLDVHKEDCKTELKPLETKKEVLESVKFYCRCGHGFTFQSSLITHINTAHNTPVETIIANLQKGQTKSKTAASPRRNVPKPKLKEGRYQCEKCCKTYINVNGYKTHYVRTHLNSIISCLQCSDVLNSREDLFVHKKLKHRYQCQNCARSFSGKKCLMAHIHLDHLKKFVNCENCGIYRIFHTGGEEKCNICYKFFRNKSRLNEHLKNTHSTTNIVCSECGKSVKRSSFSEHKRIHRGQRYECNTCKRPYKSKKSVKVCENRHQNVKPQKDDM